MTCIGRCKVSAYTGFLMGRAGGFSANFRPDVLDKFRGLCKSRGEKYTKVLEQMAEEYIRRDGNISFDPQTSKTTQPDELIKRIENLEEEEKETEETFTTAFERIEAIEKKLGLGKFA